MVHDRIRRARRAAVPVFDGVRTLDVTGIGVLGGATVMTRTAPQDRPGTGGATA